MRAGRSMDRRGKTRPQWLLPRQAKSHKGCANRKKKLPSKACAFLFQVHLFTPIWKETKENTRGEETLPAVIIHLLHHSPFSRIHSVAVTEVTQPFTPETSPNQVRCTHEYSDIVRTFRASDYTSSLPTKSHYFGAPSRRLVSFSGLDSASSLPAAIGSIFQGNRLILHVD